MNKHQKHYVIWKKLNTKDEIMHGSVYSKCSEEATLHIEDTDE